MSWEAISAWAALIAAIAALYAVWIESRLARRSNALQLLVWLDDKFDDKFNVKVKRIANYVKEHAESHTNEVEFTGEIVDDLDDVLEFIDMMGYFLKSKVLDKNSIWNNFSALILGLWFWTKNYLEKEKKRGIQWENISYLSKEMLEIEKRKTKKSLLEIERAKKKNFMDAWADVQSLPESH